MDIDNLTCTYSPRDHIVQACFLGLAAAGIGFAVGLKAGEKRAILRFENVVAAELDELEELREEMKQKLDGDALVRDLGYFGESEETAAEINFSEDQLVIELDTEEVIEISPEELSAEMHKDDDTPNEDWAFVPAEEPEEVDPDWDFAVEMSNRTTDKPYVIHEEEYMAGEYDYDQVAITYYSGDNALADERDEVIPDIEAVIGEANLGRFGNGSGDSNVMFVRNDRIKTEFEIFRSNGKYAYEVLGFTHSDDPRITRRRNARKPKGEDV